jgi:DNA polymerase-1
MIQGSLFTSSGKTNADWTPDEFPNLAGVRDVAVDFETTGLRWFAGDKPVGVGIAWKDGDRYKARYLPCGHRGGNHDPGAVQSWMRRELRDKRLYFFGGHFDVNVAYAWDVDLESQGCEAHDLGLWVALLDDHRRKSDLDSVAFDYLGERKVQGLDKTRMAEYHASEVELYGRQDAVLNLKLKDRLSPLISAEELGTVQQLEDECIYATCEMERNGAPLDEEKLDQWVLDSGQDYVKALWDLRQETGSNWNPTSSHDLKLMFAKLGIEIPMVIDTEPGKNFGRLKATFEKRYLAKIDHPAVRIVRRARRVASLRSKYLIPYQRDVRKHGVLRYALHQLRISSDQDEGEAGTISGRYSSSAYSSGDGANIQQVAGKKFGHSVKEEIDWKYNVRELFVPADRSHLSMAGDADQIEYRLWSHYAQPPWVMEAYRNDPHTDFHTAAQRLFEKVRPITRELTKDCNFAGLFGASLKKFAFMLDISEDVAEPLYSMFHERIPEAKQIYYKAMRLAETRGWVKTILGRRARFPNGEHSNAAINRVVQGSAADENKRKIVMVRKAKTGLIMRFTVHDELYGDAPDRECARRVSEILNTQVLQTDVPLYWTVNAGPNWNQCKKVAA